MKWKNIRAGLLIALVIVNFLLFIAYGIVRDQMYSVTNQEIEAVLSLYAENGVGVECVLNRQTLPQQEMLLSQEQSLGRDLIDRLLGSDYQVAWINAQKSYYMKENETALLDLENNTLTVTVRETGCSRWNASDAAGMAEQMLSRCVDDPQQWECIASIEEDGEREWRYVQKQDGVYLYFNRLIIVMDREDQISLYYQYRIPEGYSQEAREIFPLDEMMFRSLQEFRKLPESEGPHTLQKIRYGYDESGYGQVFCAEFVFDCASVRLNAFRNEVLEVIVY